MFLLGSIKGRRCSLLKGEWACKTASGARKSEIGRNLVLLVQACWTRLVPAGFWEAWCWHQLGMWGRSHWQCGCSYLVPACYCNPSKLSVTKIWEKKKVETFPSKLETVCLCWQNTLIQMLLNMWSHLLWGRGVSLVVSFPQGEFLSWCCVYLVTKVLVTVSQ